MGKRVNSARNVLRIAIHGSIPELEFNRPLNSTDEFLFLPGVGLKKDFVSAKSESCMTIFLFVRFDEPIIRLEPSGPIIVHNAYFTHRTHT